MPKQKEGIRVMLTVPSVLEWLSTTRPNKTALIFNGKQVTYKELDIKGNQFANALLSLGMAKGDKVAVLLSNCLEYFDILLGLSKGGFVAVKLNHHCKAQELLYMIGKSDAVCLVLAEEFLSTIEPLVNDLAQIRRDRYIVLGGNVPEGMTSYEILCSGSKTAVPPVRVNSHDICDLCYTAGTTGKPKAVMKTQYCRTMTYLSYVLVLMMTDKERGLLAGAFHHAAPSGIAWGTLFAGGTVVVMSSFDPEEVLYNIDKHKITNMFMAPTMYNFVLDLPAAVQTKYLRDSMKILTSAGSSLSTELKKEIIAFFPSAGLWDYLGSTELGFVSLLRPEDQMRKATSVGQEFFLCNIKLIDDNYQEVKQGEIGAIYARNVYMMAGYYKDPGATKEAFLDDQWCTVGDLARKDNEGYYYITGRKQDAIITGGVNVYPAEIEEVLLKHPKVFDVAIIGIPDKKWGESVKAVVVTKEGADLTTDEVIEYCRGQLAGFKKPRFVEFIDELPRNAAGKILKNELRQAHGER
jgi:acyl-CoA synthetase (AMP-forming)/AMP-acid ligase II